MNFDDLKDQLKEKIQEIWNKIQESESYITLKERYDNLSPNIQKTVQIGVIVFVVYFIYSIPAGFVTSANERMDYFEENRTLTRDLIRAGRIARTTTMPPPAPDYTSLQQQVDSIMLRERVLAEQKKAVTPNNNIAPANLVPKSIQQTGLRANVNQLNLKQTIKIAEDISEINSSELINLYIQADNKDPHYYSVTYEVSAFSVPLSGQKADDSTKSKFKSRAKKR